MRFQSHLPVLEAIPRWRRIHTVVELGGGTASTSTFRNKAVYADLMHLVSYETDPKWADYLEREAGDAHDVVRCEWMSDAVRELRDGHHGDLLFVDCNPEGARNMALRELADNFDLVVLHDAERNDYCEAQAVYKHRFVYDKMKPYTAVLSNTVGVEELTLVIAGRGDSYEILDPVEAA